MMNPQIQMCCVSPKEEHILKTPVLLLISLKATKKGWHAKRALSSKGQKGMQQGGTTTSPRSRLVSSSLRKRKSMVVGGYRFWGLQKGVCQNRSQPMWMHFWFPFKAI